MQIGKQSQTLKHERLILSLNTLNTNTNNHATITSKLTKGESFPGTCVTMAKFAVRKAHRQRAPNQVRSFLSWRVIRYSKHLETWLQLVIKVSYKT